jgi:hypothetical protein
VSAEWVVPGMAITAEHLRRLLDAGDDARLVVRPDHAAVVDPDVDPDGRAAVGGLPDGDGAVVLSAADLRARLAGHEPSEEMLEALARRLDAAADAHDT